MFSARNRKETLGVIGGGNPGSPGDSSCGSAGNITMGLLGCGVGVLWGVKQQTPPSRPLNTVSMVASSSLSFA